MDHIAPDQTPVTDPWRDGPPDAELDAIEAEMPVISAEVELLDAQIITLDRIPSELDEQRIRRAWNRVLAARTIAANLTGTGDVA